MGKFELNINGRLKISPPIMPASGTFGYGDELLEHFDYSSIGAIVTKGISLRPKEGNPFPRIVEVRGGMLNSIGLENIGLDRFVETKVPFYRKLGKPVIVNVFGEIVDEYVELISKMGMFPELTGFELNLSCPNVEKGGAEFLNDFHIVRRIFYECRTKTDKFISAKLSFLSDYIKLSKLAKDEGIDAVTLINTVKGMEVDIHTFKSRLGTLTGGLSGPAIKPLALRAVYEVHSNVGIPVIGCGGITNWKDAVQFFIAGASAVQIGTAIFKNPLIFNNVKTGVERYLKKKNIYFESLIGSLRCSV